MSVSFDKNRDKIIAAWKDVLDDKTSTDWALFGYEGQTNELKVVGTGDGGLEELADELNSGKIMYAFVRVEDPKTSLTKNVLINWQGEGAPVVRKGTCANHIHDVNKLLNGAQLTINARLEDEVEKELILKKVSAVGSAYSFKDHKFTEEVQKAPIGTAYSRVNPKKEINITERDNFWRKEEEEEKRRVEVEKERKRQELMKVEEERRMREQKEHLEREQRIVEDALKKSSTELSNSMKSPVTPIVSPISQPEPPTSRGMTQAELMRQQRNQEAKALIGSRVGTAKAIFSQNSASGQMQTKAAPAKPVRNSIQSRINSLNNPQLHQQQETEQQKENETVPAQQHVAVVTPVQRHEDVESATMVSKTEPIPEEPTQPVKYTNGSTAATAAVAPVPTNGLANVKIPPASAEEEDEGDQYSTIKRSPHSKTAPSQVSTPEDDEDNSQVVAAATVTQQVVQDVVGQNENELIPVGDMLGDFGLKARALYDYQAADESEITFDPDDIITNIDQIDEGWWQGLAPDGSYGLFPANYVELIKD